MIFESYTITHTNHWLLSDTFSCISFWILTQDERIIILLLNSLVQHIHSSHWNNCLVFIRFFLCMRKTNKIQQKKRWKKKNIEYKWKKKIKSICFMNILNTMNIVQSFFFLFSNQQFKQIFWISLNTCCLSILLTRIE